ncbi:hypothetical protein HJG60_009801 [Phyllostomus discolor]|uniref:Uncharacterized protein n=1 Tax=Phyllostomus discolor TaxID=89673 RepID=A0A834B889_9CHIR|nr:hypothetical protein HJG60_009801 [Phyllostomus discolor]
MPHSGLFTPIDLPLPLSPELLPDIWHGHTLLRQHCAAGASCPVRSQSPQAHTPRCFSSSVSLPEDGPAPPRAGPHMPRLRRPHVADHTQAHTHEHTCMLMCTRCPRRPSPICTGVPPGMPAGRVVRMLPCRGLSQTENESVPAFHHIPQNRERPVLVPTSPPGALGSAPGTLGSGNCFLQIPWNGQCGSSHSGWAKSQDSSPDPFADMSGIAVPTLRRD